MSGEYSDDVRVGEDRAASAADWRPSVSLGQSAPPGFAQQAEEERVAAAYGWGLAIGVTVLLLGAIVFAVYRVSDRNILAVVVAGAIALIISGLLVRSLLRRCNYSLPCFLTGAAGSRKVQPIAQLRALPVVTFDTTAPTKR